MSSIGKVPQVISVRFLRDIRIWTKDYHFTTVIQDLVPQVPLSVLIFSTSRLEVSSDLFFLFQLTVNPLDYIPVHTTHLVYWHAHRNLSTGGNKKPPGIRGEGPVDGPKTINLNAEYSILHAGVVIQTDAKHF
jgi:hypothetical protein